MTLLLIGLALIYVWAFLKTYIRYAPDWLVFIMLPVVAWGLTMIPATLLLVLAACGIVFLTNTGESPRRVPKTAKRKSNIPPPP